MMILQWVRFCLAVLFMLAGLLTLLATIVGLFRFHYVLNRIHVAAKCDTMGMIMIFFSLLVINGPNAASLKLLLIIAFLWLANPVASHLIAHMEVATNPRAGEEYEVIRYDAD